MTIIMMQEKTYMVVTQKTVGSNLVCMHSQRESVTLSMICNDSYPLPILLCAVRKAFHAPCNQGIFL